MAVKKLSNISYMPVVESINRKFALRKETLNPVWYRRHRETTQEVKVISGYMGGASRTARVNDQLVRVNYFWMRKNARNTPTSQAEQLARNNFTKAVKSAQATLKNLAVITIIQSDFYGHNLPTHTAVRTRERVFSGDYTTMRGWIVAVRLAQIAKGESITETTDTWFTD